MGLRCLQSDNRWNFSSLPPIRIMKGENKIYKCINILLYWLILSVRVWMWPENSLRQSSAPRSTCCRLWRPTIDFYNMPEDKYKLKVKTLGTLFWTLILQQIICKFYANFTLIKFVMSQTIINYSIIWCWSLKQGKLG